MRYFLQHQITSIYGGFSDYKTSSEHVAKQSLFLLCPTLQFTRGWVPATKAHIKIVRCVRKRRIAKCVWDPLVASCPAVSSALEQGPTSVWCTAFHIRVNARPPHHLQCKYGMDPMVVPITKMPLSSLKKCRNHRERTLA